MSKYELQAEALQASGISVEKSQEAINLAPSIFDRLGIDGFQELSTLFYNRVFDDDDPRFKSIFSSSTKLEAIENQYRFFVQTFGGPDLYRQTKGKYTRLVGRHANYSIGKQAAHRWVEHMEAAMEEHSVLSKDEEARKCLVDYFKYTAQYIVVASKFMRSDQLSGGTSVDKGRVW
ncbi:unnamed protein product [Cylindrotheca closterium]|uniref:Globin n=1 Tax=Cylindrotheca closterium TaxID=2856 RepID=A0AAD2G2F2_9STRA|nr:unnamed protein product [Cylindrotheca closterium]